MTPKHLRIEVVGVPAAALLALMFLMARALDASLFLKRKSSHVFTKAFVVTCLVSSLSLAPRVALAADSDGFRLPLLDGATQLQINRDFGEGGVGGHLAQDFAAGFGEPVYAASNGKVVYSYFSETDNYNDGWGNTLMIEHANSKLPGEKVYTHYSHLSRVDVAVGDVVGKGQVIGAIGSTGDSGGPHLHFEIKSAPKLGDGYTRFDFTGNTLDYDNMTYFRPTWFIETYRTLPAGPTLNALAGKTVKRGEWNIRYSPDASLGMSYGFIKGDRAGEVGFKSIPYQPVDGSITAFRDYTVPFSSVTFNYDQNYETDGFQLEISVDGIPKKTLASTGAHSERVTISGLKAKRIEFTWKVLRGHESRRESYARIADFSAISVGSTGATKTVSDMTRVSLIAWKASKLVKRPGAHYTIASILVLAVGIAGGGCLYRRRRAI